MAERFKLTTKTVEDRCLPPFPGEVNGNGRPVVQKIYWDAEDRGFGVLVGTKTRTFIAQADVRGRTVRVKIGRFPKVPAEMARKRAKELLAKMAMGTDPNAAKREQEWQTFTLSAAMEHHIVRLNTKGCSPRTPECMRYELGRFLGDWMHRPLASITAKECFGRHQKVTKDAGPYAANRCMRMLRAIWNSARRLYPGYLPEHPVLGVQFNAEERRKDIVPPDQLPGWWAKVRGLSNPVRRDVNLVMLFTGLRATDAATIRWDDIDFTNQTIHRPEPKGGKKRAFTVPLCRYLVRLLARRRRDNHTRLGDDKGWVFPTYNRAGKVTHISEPKEQRFVDLPNGHRQKSFHLPSPHTLRRTFASACKAAGVDFYTIKILMNHALPKADVTEGYITPDMDVLRAAVEKVAAWLLARKRARCQAEKPNAD